MSMKIDWLRFLPPYWMQNYPTNWDWDDALNQLLDDHEPTKFGPYSVLLGGIAVWSGNYPFAYGHPYGPERDFLPSVATRRRLRDAIAAADERRFWSEFEAKKAKANG